jgi:hypothetical protein
VGKGKVWPPYLEDQSDILYILTLDPRLHHPGKALLLLILLLLIPASAASLLSSFLT